MVGGDRPWNLELGGIILHQRGGALGRTSGALTEVVFRSILCSNVFVPFRDLVNGHNLKPLLENSIILSITLSQIISSLCRKSPYRVRSSWPTFNSTTQDSQITFNLLYRTHRGFAPRACASLGWPTS